MLVVESEHCVVWHLHFFRELSGMTMKDSFMLNECKVSRAVSSIACVQ